MYVYYVRIKWRLSSSCLNEIRFTFSPALNGLFLIFHRLFVLTDSDQDGGNRSTGTYRCRYKASKFYSSINQKLNDEMLQISTSIKRKKKNDLFAYEWYCLRNTLLIDLPSCVISYFNSLPTFTMQLLTEIVQNCTACIVLNPC